MAEQADDQGAKTRPGPRIDLVTEPAGEAAEVLAQAMTRDGEPINIFGVLAHHPKLMKRFNLLGGFFLNKGLLPAREREIVILRIGWNCQAKYEFGQHTLIGRACGLSDDEISALAGGTRAWSDDDQRLIDMADELCDDDCVGDATYAALAKRWSEAELIELVQVAGFYRLVSGFLNTFGVELDEGVPGFPND